MTRAAETIRPTTTRARMAAFLAIVSRFFTDRVTGFGSGLKKNIGRRQVVEAMAEHFEELRRELEKSAEHEQ